MRALVLLLLLFGLPVGIVVLVIEDQPAATAPAAADHTDVDRLRDLFRRNDPRRLPAGERREVVFTERDVNLALRHGLARTDRVQAHVGLVSGAAEVALTVHLPANPLGRFFNLTARVASDADGLVVERCAAGRLPVPAWLANPALRLLHRGLLEVEDYRLATTAVREVEFRPGALSVDLVWRPELSERLQESGRSLILPEEDRVRLAAWVTRVDLALGSFGRSVSLARVLAPLFEQARAQGGDAAAENRALLLALGLQAAGRRAAAAARAGGIPAPKARTRLTLGGRWDLGRHLLVSAAATIAADAGLADAAGLLKEIDDSRDGSGFSFADLAADRAGVRLAEAAMSEGSARRLQERLSTALGEDDFMPPIDGLDEGLSEDAFRRRYGSIEDPRYRSVVASIDERIDARPVFR